MTTPDRYTWLVEVEDAHDRPRTLAIGEENGRVIYALLDEQGRTAAFFSADPDACDLISAVTNTARDRALQHPRWRR